MTPNRNHRVTVAADGSVTLPPEIARKYGLTPGAELKYDEKEGGLELHQPISHLAKLYIEPTSLCNLNCVTCIRNAWEEPMGRMSAETFDRIIEGLKQFDPAPSIFFGGFGEPLSHPHIVEMVARAREISHTVELITNGVLLTEARATALIKAGLTRIWVSVDGATPEHFADVRLGAELPKIFKHIAGYRRIYRRLNSGRDPDIGIAFVAMQRNISDLPDLLRMSYQLGVSRYLVTNVLPYTQEMCKERLYTRFIDHRIGDPSPWSPVLDMPPMDAAPVIHQPLEGGLYTNQHHFFLSNELGEHKNYCPFVRRGAAAVGWDGGLTACLPMLHTHENYLLNIRQVIQRHSFGSLNQNSLKEVWDLPEYVAFRKRVDEFDFPPCTVCAGCELAEANQDDCFGNPFPTCGGCLWAQGFIRCP